MASLIWFLGLGVLAVILILSALAIWSIVFTNWVTIIRGDEILISRFTGIVKVHWYWRDPQRNTEEFGFSHWWNEQIIFTRYLMAFAGAVPIWEIRYGDFKNRSLVKVCYLSESKIVVTCRDADENWLEKCMSKEEFEKSPYSQIVKRAANLQIDVRKRFKPLMSGRAA